MTFIQPCDLGTTGVSRQRSGWTLVETLVVLAIIAIVSGLIYTAVVAAKPKSYDALDISNLHQLGIAGTIYAEENDNRFPLSVGPLLKLKRVPKAILASRLDPTSVGIRNSIMYGNELPPELEGTKITYVGPGEGNWKWENYSKFVLPGRNPGWLVNLSKCEVDPPRNDYKAPLGLYQRLLLDTSVVTRRNVIQPFILKSGKPEKSIEFIGLFNDESAQWFEDRGP